MKVVNEGKYDISNHGGGGRRKGKLPKKTKEKAARVRKVGACWNCWLLKVSVSIATSTIFWCGSIYHSFSIVGGRKLVQPRSFEVPSSSNIRIGLLFHQSMAKYDRVRLTA